MPDEDRPLPSRAPWLLLRWAAADVYIFDCGPATEEDDTDLLLLRSDGWACSKRWSGPMGPEEEEEEGEGPLLWPPAGEEAVAGEEAEGELGRALAAAGGARPPGTSLGAGMPGGRAREAALGGTADACCCCWDWDRAGGTSLATWLLLPPKGTELPETPGGDLLTAWCPSR